MIYFGKKELLKLGKVLNEWDGTPWRHRFCLKKVGCDCVHFVLGVFEDLGIEPRSPIEIPEYPPDWHLHNTRELLREGLKKYFNVQEIPLYWVRDGDIILAHYGRAASHAGFLLDGFFYHCTRPGGVSKGSFYDRNWRERMKFALRLLK